MNNTDIGNRLGILINRHNAYSPTEKGLALAEIVIYIRALESKLEASK